MKFENKILPESINDLRDKYFEGQPLTDAEKLALSNFDQYRIRKLNAVASDSEFKMEYLKIQAMANLTSYTYFLKNDILHNA